MLRLVLVLATINVAWCNDNCPLYTAFDTFTHSSEDFRSLLSGTYLIVYTSAPLVHCHKVTYVVDANNVVTGRVESPGCCVQTDNYNFTSTKLTYDVGPVQDYAPNCPSLVKETGLIKLLATTGSGNSFCIIDAVCQPDYYGITVSCRQSAPLLLSIQILLFNLLGEIGLTEALALKTVRQTNCVFPSNNCP